MKIRLFFPLGTSDIISLCNTCSLLGVQGLNSGFVTVKYRGYWKSVPGTGMGTDLIPEPDLVECLSTEGPPEMNVCQTSGFPASCTAAPPWGLCSVPSLGELVSPRHQSNEEINEV